MSISYLNNGDSHGTARTIINQLVTDANTAIFPYSGSVTITGSVIIRNGITNDWSFNDDGSTSFPLLTTQRGDISSGTINGFTLCLGAGTNQAVISTPDGIQSYPNSQRLVINPGQGSGSYEGGDIYLWAGRGGNDGGTGGDIKIRGGYGPINGGGGYVRIDGGDSYSGSAGYVQLQGGDGAFGPGGEVLIIGGRGNSNTQNANVYIKTYDITGALKTWTFDTNGDMQIPGDISSSIASSNILYSSNGIITGSNTLKYVDSTNTLLFDPDIDFSLTQSSYNNDAHRSIELRNSKGLQNFYPAVTSISKLVGANSSDTVMRFTAFYDNPSEILITGFKCDYTIYSTDGSNNSACNTGTLLCATNNMNGLFTAYITGSYLSGDQGGVTFGLDGVTFSTQLNGTDVLVNMDTTGTSYDVSFTGLFTFFNRKP